MNLTLEQLKETVDTLTIADRAELARHLMKNLPDELYDDLCAEEGTDEEIRAAWHDELRSRMEDIRSGKEVGIPSEQVLAELREKYK